MQPSVDHVCIELTTLKGHGITIPPTPKMIARPFMTAMGPEAEFVPESGGMRIRETYYYFLE